MVRTICLTMLVTLGIWITDAAEARDRGFINYDGDTFLATFRVANIDTPEIEGKCEAERDLAQKAKLFTERFLARGDVVIRQTGVDRYGRILALVTSDQQDLGEALIAAGLARTWKGRREQWC